MATIYTLVNGEQIIGVGSAGWESVTTQTNIKDPFYIIEAQDEYGNNGMKLINVCTFSDQQYIVVDNKHIVFSVPANDHMTRYYQKLVAAHSNADTYKMLEEAIGEMDDMEQKMRDVIAKRLVGGSTIN